jgi:hypothetical protein
MRTIRFGSGLEACGVHVFGDSRESDRRTGRDISEVVQVAAPSDERSSLASVTHVSDYNVGSPPVERAPKVRATDL